MIASVLMFVAGLVLLGAGFWWLWGGRWSWLRASRMQQSCSHPTRMVIGLAHLVLGYHLAVWSLPTERKPIQVPRQQWPWVVFGAAMAIGASRLLDRYDTPMGDGGTPS